MATEHGTKGNGTLVPLSEATKAFLETTFSSEMANSDRNKWVEKFWVPECDFLRCPKLNVMLKPWGDMTSICPEGGWHQFLLPPYVTWNSKVNSTQHCNRILQLHAYHSLIHEPFPPFLSGAQFEAGTRWSLVWSHFKINCTGISSMTTLVQYFVRTQSLAP